MNAKVKLDARPLHYFVKATDVITLELCIEFKSKTAPVARNEGKTFLVIAGK